MKINKWLIAGLGILISGVFLWFAFRNLNPEAVWAHIQQLNPVWLLLATAVLFLSMILIAWRWGFLLRSIKPVPLGYLTQVVLVGYMGNNVYPFRTGEILRIVLLQRFQRIPVAKSTMTVIVERVFDGLVMLTFILCALPLVPISSPEIQAMIRIATPLFLIALVAFFVLAARPTLFHGVLRSVGRWLPESISARLFRLGDELINGLQGLRSPLDLAGAVFASFASWSVQAVVYWMVAFAFNLQVSLPAMFLTVGVVNLAGLVPASPGQIGVFEFFTGLVLVAVGVNQTQAQAYALVLHVIVWLPVTLAGFFFLAKQGLGWDAITDARGLEQQTVSS